MSAEQWRRDQITISSVTYRNSLDKLYELLHRSQLNLLDVCCELYVYCTEYIPTWYTSNDYRVFWAVHSAHLVSLVPACLV